MTELSDTAVADQLLAALRERTGLSQLDYAEPPQPITGGFETLTYGFRLAAAEALPEHLDRPLVLRIFSAQVGPAQSQREAAVQNSLSDLAFPVPLVREQFDSGIDGRSFNIMDRVEGESLLSRVASDPAQFQPVVKWTALVHTRLHQVDPVPVIRGFEDAGFPLEGFSFEQRLSYLNRYFAGDTFAQLRPCMDWLNENRPEQQSPPAVCHGDFHPGNIMVNGDKVTGVIDWPGISFADPELDVATSLILIKVGAAQVDPEALPMVMQMADYYIATYSEIRPLDSSKIEYYEVLRSFRAFTRGTAMRTPETPAELMPRDGYVWSSDIALKLLRSLIGEITGIELPLPDGVES